MESLEGIEELHMSGARAVFEAEPGVKFTEDQVSAAFEEKGLTLISFEQTRRRPPAELYLVDSGIT